MAAGPQLPEGAASKVDYWLRRCEGFRVDSADGRVGFVEEVRYASRLDRPDLIVVRAGLLGRLLLIVPVGEIAEIRPREERIILLRSPRPTATERLQDRRPSKPATGTEPGTASPKAAGAGAERVEAEKEVEMVITRLLRRIGLRRGRGGEREMTPDVEPSAEPSAKEPAGEEAAAEEAAEAVTTEAVPAEEPAAEQPPAEAPPAEEHQPTA